MLALESSLFPIDNLDWRNFYKNSSMDAAWERIKGTIDWSNIDVAMQPFVCRVCELKLNDRWKSFKSQLRRFHYKPNIGTPMRFICTHPSVNQSQWRLLVAEWDKATNQAAWEQQKQAATEAQVEIEGLRLANTKLAEELRQEQAVTMEAHKKKMEDEFEKMKENIMNELNKLAQNPITNDSARGLMENSVGSFHKWFGRVDINSDDPIDGDDYVMVERENDGDYSPILPAQLDLNSM